MTKMLRFSSHRFIPRNEYSLPELTPRVARVTRHIHLVSARSAPRSGLEPGLPADLRR